MQRIKAKRASGACARAGRCTSASSLLCTKIIQSQAVCCPPAASCCSSASPNCPLAPVSTCLGVLLIVPISCATHQTQKVSEIVLKLTAPWHRHRCCGSRATGTAPPARPPAQRTSRQPPSSAVKKRNINQQRWSILNISGQLQPRLPPRACPHPPPPWLALPRSTPHTEALASSVPVQVDFSPPAHQRRRCRGACRRRPPSTGRLRAVRCAWHPAEDNIQVK